METITHNIGLTDMLGRSVDSIQVIPDRYTGEHKVMLRGLHNTRLVQCKSAAYGEATS